MLLVILLRGPSSSRLLQSLGVGWLPSYINTHISDRPGTNKQEVRKVRRYDEVLLTRMLLSWCARVGSWCCCLVLLHGPSSSRLLLQIGVGWLPSYINTHILDCPGRTYGKIYYRYMNIYEIAQWVQSLCLTPKHVANTASAARLYPTTTSSNESTLQNVSTTQLWEQSIPHCK
jgi:hypothetical protein